MNRLSPEPESPTVFRESRGDLLRLQSEWLEAVGIASVAVGLIRGVRQPCAHLLLEGDRVREARACVDALNRRDRILCQILESQVDDARIFDERIGKDRIDCASAD